jgi:hypothetical protein
MTIKISPSIFLCHASEDKKKVRELYQKLKSSGFKPWFDEENLLPGQDWDLEIKKAVKNSDVVLVCLSKKAISKRGYVQKEINHALDVAEEQPEGYIYIIPVKLAECVVPDRLSKWHWVDLFHPKGYQRLVQSLNQSASRLYKIHKEEIEAESVIEFAPYMKGILVLLWNDGKPQEIPLNEIGEKLGIRAYANHMKLSYSPWGLINKGYDSRNRRLTRKGISFITGNIQIPRKIKKNIYEKLWEPVVGTEMIAFDDL